MSMEGLKIKKGEYMMKKKYLMLLLSLILVLAACGGGGAENSNEESQPEGQSAFGTEQIEYFEAINQDEETVTRDDLLGQWWVADFIFTNCTTVCLPMTSNMKILQDGLKEAGIEDVQLVTFSIDPDRDTPEVLKEYGNEYGADFSNWHFLTGYDFEYIKNYSISEFKNLVQEPPEGDDQIIHGTAFYLINPDGVIYKHYSCTQADAMDEIIADLKEQL